MACVNGLEVTITSNLDVALRHCRLPTASALYPSIKRMSRNGATKSTSCVIYTFQLAKCSYGLALQTVSQLRQIPDSLDDKTALIHGLRKLHLALA